MPNVISKYHVRWLIRRDFVEVMDIERRSFPDPWKEEQFLECLRERNVIGMVAENLEMVVGYMIYSIHPRGFRIMTFAVHPEWRHAKVGTTMVEKLKEKLSSLRRNKLMAHLPERNLDAQLFFRAQGFECVRTERTFFDNGEDAYVMKYLHREPVGVDIGN